MSIASRATERIQLIAGVVAVAAIHRLLLVAMRWEIERRGHHVRSAAHRAVALAVQPAVNAFGVEIMRARHLFANVPFEEGLDADRADLRERKEEQV